MNTVLAKKVLFLGLWLCLSGTFAEAFAQAASQNDLYLVRRIYIEEMGASDEAARFRLLLEDKLSERGFAVVKTPGEADASLTGALSVSSAGYHGGSSDVSVTARLISSGGNRLWSINLPKPLTLGSALKFKGLIKTKEPVEYRAEEFAAQLRSDWEKSAKSAGVKVGK